LALSAVIGSTINLVAQESKRFVYVVPIEGMIDLGLAPFIQRVLKEATENKAAAVVLEINTFGGRVNAAVQIRDALLDSNITTIAWGHAAPMLPMVNISRIISL
jgi:membrane-bound serine protease (ClpP class)